MLGEEIKKRRLRKKLTQEELAGVTATYVDIRIGLYNPHNVPVEPLYSWCTVNDFESRPTLPSLRFCSNERAEVLAVVIVRKAANAQSQGEWLAVDFHPPTAIFTANEGDVVSQFDQPLLRIDCRKLHLQKASVMFTC